MKICIAGAGAMGGRFGYKLVESGADVYFVDTWGPNVEAIRKDGLKVDEDGKKSVVNIPIYYPNEINQEGFRADLIILFVKAMQLDDMLMGIKALLTDSTYVLCLLNGIGHDSVIERHVPRNRILLGNTMWTAGMDGPGSVKLLGNGNIDLQNLEESGKEMALRVADVLDKAGLEARFSQGVSHMIYKKACVNGTVNGMCALLECNIKAFGDTKSAEAIVRTIVGEFADVAAAEGVEMNREEVVRHVLKTFDPGGVGLHYPSMYQDLVKNRRLTEIDYINGAIVERGRQYGIATPYCTFLTQLVHAKEEVMGAQ